MVQLFGRITKDAATNNVNNDRQVVNFSIALNDSYKDRSGQQVKSVTYVNCTYWLSTGIAPYLNKGTLVEIIGRISVSAYMTQQGNPAASLDFHVNSIKIYGGGTMKAQNNDSDQLNQATIQPHTEGSLNAPADDLPF